MTHKIHVEQLVIRPKTEGDDGKIHDKDYHNRKHKHDGKTRNLNYMLYVD